MNNAALERLSSITERVQARPAAAALEQAPAKKEAYRWKATTVVEETKVEVATPKALKKALEHEKTPELAAKLAEEAVERDSWAAEVSQLAVPKLVEQVALNAWKEQEGSRVCLHLRPSQRHLNSASAQQKLAEALGVLYGTPVELTIVEDDNPAMRTPLEWRQAIYEEKPRRRAKPLSRIITFRPCVVSSTPIWMKRVFAPFECQSDWHSVPLTMTD